MAWTLDDIPDQSGRVVVVTGANSGIGMVTARVLARRGAHVVLACRDPERGYRAADEVGAEFRRLDLADLGSVRDFAETWPHDRLDLLVNNAGIAMVPFSRTVDGFESHFGINHLGHFALTGLLMRHLQAASDPRVVTVTSEGQVGARFDLGNLDAERSYRAPIAYWQSKKANVYFGMELQRRAAAAQIPLRSMVVAPGLTRTNILTGQRGPVYRALVERLVRHVFRPAEAGAQTSLHAATAPDLPGGSYLAPSGLYGFYGDPVLRNGHRAVYDTATARELWRLSEERTGVRYAPFAERH